MSNPLHAPWKDRRTVRQVERVSTPGVRTVTTYWYHVSDAVADLRARIGANPSGRWGYVYDTRQPGVTRVRSWRKPKPRQERSE